MFLVVLNSCLEQKIYFDCGYIVDSILHNNQRTMIVRINLFRERERERERERKPFLLVFHQFTPEGVAQGRQLSFM